MYVISGEKQREERYDSPVEAIREFFNPGKLCGGLTIDNLLSGIYSSRTGNGALARIFNDCGLIKRYGSGIIRVLNECKLYGLKKPVFKEFAEGSK